MQLAQQNTRCFEGVEWSGVAEQGGDRLGPGAAQAPLAARSTCGTAPDGAFRSRQPGVRRRDDGVDAVWALSWPEQRATGINPIIIRAFYSARAHHPHVQGGTVGDWALNPFDEEQAAAELPNLRAIASADIHNLVFQRDYRIIPAIVSGLTR